MAQRGARTARALTSAVLATFVAAAFHTIGGGDAPGPVTLLLAVASATLVCLPLSRVRLSLPRLTASVVLSQAAFHFFFELTGGSTGLASHQHGATIAPVEAASLSHQAAPMSASHLAAAVVTVMLLAFGERAAIAALRTLMWLVWRPAALARIAAGEFGGARRFPSYSTRSASITRNVVATPLLRRGPPLSL